MWYARGTDDRGRVYGAALPAADEREAEQRRLELALGLSGGRQEPWMLKARGFRRYLKDIGKALPTVETAAEATSADLLSAYAEEIRKALSPGWQTVVLGHLRALARFAGGQLAAVTPAQAAAWLSHIVTSPGRQSKRKGPRTPATANRALAAASRFYKWAVRTERLSANPFEGIKALRTQPPESIVYLTPPERDAVLRAAADLPDGAALWTALHTGLRRGEIARLAWADVRLDTGRLTVRKSKTGRPRTMPLASALADFLSARRPADGAGRVVPWPADFKQWDYRAEKLLKVLRTACPNIPPERIRWNSFRATVASILCQSGVPLDTVAAWLGHSAQVAKTFYVQFVPRDQRNGRIDLLNGGGAGRP